MGKCNDNVHRIKHRRDAAQRLLAGEQNGPGRSHKGFAPCNAGISAFEACIRRLYEIQAPLLEETEEIGFRAKELLPAGGVIEGANGFYQLDFVGTKDKLATEPDECCCELLINRQGGMCKSTVQICCFYLGEGHWQGGALEAAAQLAQDGFAGGRGWHRAK